MKKNGVLMVEGRDDVAVISALAKIYNIHETFYLKDIVGLERLLDEFSVVLETARLKGSEFDIERLGIVVDANNDITQRGESIIEILMKKGYPTDNYFNSKGMIVKDDSKEIPVVGAWIMPDNTNPGMLEDFFKMFIPQDNNLLHYVNECIDSIEKDPSFDNPEPRSKAETRTWLAWQKKSESRMGYFLSEKKDDLNVHNDSAKKFIDWIQRLFNT